MAFSTCLPPKMSAGDFDHIAQVGPAISAANIAALRRVHVDGERLSVVARERGVSPQMLRKVRAALGEVHVKATDWRRVDIWVPSPLTETELAAYRERGGDMPLVGQAQTLIADSGALRCRVGPVAAKDFDRTDALLAFPPLKRAAVRSVLVDGAEIQTASVEARMTFQGLRQAVERARAAIAGYPMHWRLLSVLAPPETASRLVAIGNALLDNHRSSHSSLAAARPRKRALQTATA